MSRGLIPLGYMSQPEHIGAILKRIFADLEKVYGRPVPRVLTGIPDPLDPPREDTFESPRRIEANAGA